MTDLLISAWEAWEAHPKGDLEARARVEALDAVAERDGILPARLHDRIAAHLRAQQPAHDVRRAVTETVRTLTTRKAA